MSEITQHHCLNCGGTLTDVGGDTLKCKYCGSTFENRSLERKLQSMQELLDQAKLEYVNNQRRNLYDAVHAKYVSMAEVRQYATEIKKHLPDDFQANFYLQTLSGDAKEINRIIRRIDVDANYDSLPAVIHFLIASLQIEYLLELNNLIERAYKKRDLPLFSRYATEISEEAEKVSEGVYATEVPRDVFIAYSSKDMDKVSELCEELESQGISCFVAARNLRHGVGAVENYDSALKEAMDNCRCFVFVSSVNSRSLSCDAVTKEIPYIRGRDIENAPAHLRNNYSAIPDIYKKPRVEYRIGNEKSSDAVSRITDAFFEGHEWTYTPADVAVRIVKMLYEEPAPAPVAEAISIMPAAQQPTKKKSKAPIIAVASILLAGAVTVGALVVPGLAGKASDTPPVDTNLDNQIITPSGNDSKQSTSTTKKQSPGTNPVEDTEDTNTPYGEVTGSQGLKFTSNNDGTCYVSGLGNCSDTDLVIPTSSPDGDRVVGIQKQAFWHNSRLTSVTIPEGIVTIGESAFEHCTNITSVALPDGLTTIERSAFRDCEKMTSITLPDTLTTLDSQAFYQCDALITITIPQHVASIGESAFYRCRSLQSLTIQNGVGSIGANAFQSCYDLTSVAIPGSVVLIGANAFKDCSQMKTLAISDGVMNISDQAFYGCSALTSVFIPSSVSTIGSQVFYGCKNINEFLVDNNNSRYEAPNNCLIDTSTSILIAGFKGAKISGSFTKIEAYAFYEIPDIKSIDIPNGATHIGDYAFYGCNYTGELTIADDLQYIGQNALSLNHFTSITVDPANKSFRSIDNCLIDIASTSLILAADVSSSITLPSDGSITNIHASAFEGSKKITSITIPEGVTTIEDSTFNNCTQLQEVHLANSVTRIEANAFASCSRLSKVTWSEGLLYIGENAFNKCTDLLSVTISSQLEYIGKNAFSGCSKLSTVSLPNTVKQIEDNAFSGCKKLASFVLPNELTYLGSSVFSSNYALTNIIGGNADSKYRAIGNCIVETATKTLIFGCTTSEIPADGSVTRIGTKAFYGYGELLSITIPKGITHIDSYAFSNCGLLSITIPDGTLQVKDGAFNNCLNLTTIYLPASLKTFDYSAINFGGSIVKDIYYAGTEEQWKALGITIPRTATVHYNTVY